MTSQERDINYTMAVNDWVEQIIIIGWQDTINVCSDIGGADNAKECIGLDDDHHALIAELL